MLLVKGSILNPKSDTVCDYFDDGALLIGNVLSEAKDKDSSAIRNGKVVDIGNCDELCKRHNIDLSQENPTVKVIDLRGKLIFPCFSDIHFHWVQDDVSLMPKDSLMEWLNKYTFPAEEKFHNPTYSLTKAQGFFRKLLKAGTTMGAIYTSIHTHTVDHAFESAKGNFLIGSPIMTRNCPEKLSETDSESATKNTLLAQKYNGHHHSFKHKYAITPRFLPSCTAESLKDAKEIADTHKLWIQTHLAETKDPEESSVSGLEEQGLLTEKTILAHCLYLDNEGFKTIARYKSKIAHCPSSNAPVSEMGLGSGLFDFQKAEEHDIDWALASDIGAGPYLSMLDVMKSFVEQNEKLGGEAKEKATATKALYRASLKGAEILGLDSKGNLEIGKDADFLVLESTDSANGNQAERVIKEILNNSRENFNSIPKAIYLSGEEVDL